MWRQRLQEAVRRLAADDPLALGLDPDWRSECVDDRRYSRIFLLHPRETAAAAVQERLGSDAVVLKLYHATQPERRQREYDDLVRVHQAHGAAGSVVRPVAGYADLGAVLTGRAPGLPAAPELRAACRRGSWTTSTTQALAICQRAGEWLRQFQDAGTRPMLGQRSPHLATPAEFSSYVDERLEAMQRRPFAVDAALRGRVGDAFRQILTPASLEPVTWSHSDFGPHNLLASEDSIVVLDFELAPQHPWFDAAYFVESLAAFGGPWVDGARVAELQRAFLHAYGIEGREPLFLALRIRHLACTAVSLRRCRGHARWRSWPDLAASRRRLTRLVEALDDAPAGHPIPA